jgi:hypothetical protein
MSDELKLRSGYWQGFITAIAVLITASLLRFIVFKPVTDELKPTLPAGYRQGFITAITVLITASLLFFRSSCSNLLQDLGQIGVGSVPSSAVFRSVPSYLRFGEPYNQSMSKSPFTQ